MPVSIPGFVFDPATNRYYKEAPRSQESSSANTAMRRIAVQRFEARNAQRREAAKKRPRGGPGRDPRGPAQHPKRPETPPTPRQLWDPRSACT